jgi:hypothetical protein
MTSFSPTDVAFEGFRLTRERPRAVIAWACCYLVFTFGLGIVAQLTLGSQAETLIANFRAATNDQVAAEAAMQKLTPFVFGGLPLYFAFQAVFTCAVYRAVLRPRESRAGFLRLGWDELRMFVLNLILSLLWGAVLFGVAMVTAVAAEAASTTAPSGMVLIGDATTLVMISAGVMVLVRLSLAGPMTFAERRLRVFDSWRLTRGSFWRLFGAYLLAFMLGVVVLLLMFLVISAIVGVGVELGGGNPLASLNMTSASPAILAVAFVSQAAGAFMLTCFLVVWKAAPAQAYKDITGGRYPP